MSTTTIDAPAPTSRRRWRWAAPLAAVALVAAGSFTANSLADANPGLPPTTPQQLVTEALSATVPGMSGTVRTSVELGLPDLSVLGEQGAGGSSVLDWLSGTHTVRVWQSGEDRQRVSVPSGDNEYGVYRTGDTTWLWSSSEQKAVRVTGTTSTGRLGGTHTPPTPQEAAKALLDEVGSTSTITLASNATVAGRPAYRLIVTPAQAGSKVDRVELAVDGATKVPLSAEVFARATSKPAVSVGFTSVDFAVPADSVFAFTPPPGTKVETKQVGGDHAGPSSKPERERGSEPKVVGSGWQTVVVASGVGAAAADQAQAQQVLATLPRVRGAWGSGRLFDGPLFSVVLTDDGRVAAGAVVPDRLYAALT